MSHLWPQERPFKDPGAQAGLQDGKGRPRSPLQNRVTPLGDIVAIDQRGMFTGNRGIIHNPATKTLLKRRWTNTAWIVCSCAYKDRRREIMAERSWTELFFWDEAVALAAGHRPCFLCRPKAAKQFRAAWAASKGIARVSSKEIDAVLHRERLENRRKRLHAVPSSIEVLPDGVMVLSKGEAFTLQSAWAFHWTEKGYGAPERLSHADHLLTPPSTLDALMAGYRPILHSSINA